MKKQNKIYCKECGTDTTVLIRPVLSRLQNAVFCDLECFMLNEKKESQPKDEEKCMQ